MPAVGLHDYCVLAFIQAFLNSLLIDFLFSTLQEKKVLFIEHLNKNPKVFFLTISGFNIKKRFLAY
jgi:hypothetical protein